MLTKIRYHDGCEQESYLQMDDTPQQQRRNAFARRLETLLFQRYADGPPEHAWAMQEQLPEVLGAFDRECARAKDELEFAQKNDGAKERLRQRLQLVRDMVHKALTTEDPIDIVDGRYAFQDALHDLNQLSRAAYSPDYHGFATQRDEAGNIHVTGHDDPRAYRRSGDARPTLESFSGLLGGLNDAMLAADYYYVPAVETVIEASHMTHPGKGETIFYDAMKRYGELYREWKLGETVAAPDGERPKEMRDILPDARNERNEPLYPEPPDTPYSEILRNRNFDELDRIRAIEKINVIPVPPKGDFDHGPFEKAMHGWNCWACNQTRPLSDEKRFDMPGYARHKEMTPRKFLNEVRNLMENGRQWLDDMRKVAGILEKSAQDTGNGRDRELADFTRRFAATLETTYKEIRSQRRLAGIPPSALEPGYGRQAGRTAE